ncbi:DUF2325 domain-containing protein [Virgibacillus pantothenticus]|uniref:DUF2325 domain-containing protein n=1 Tax=Virgibacillus pantothenticus TaxID=1473 RepID=UPI00098510BA|nr:DUF2325 domain-containing protein [Virgibacillus pantothenticus]
MNETVHVKVYFSGRCPRCNRYNEELTYDYGVKPYKDVEKEMDKVNHKVQDMLCKYCSTDFAPESLIYKETLADVKLAQVAINYDNTLDAETSRLLNAAHANRFDFFKQHESEFWDGFVAQALQNWRDSINELQPHELLAGLNALNIPTNGRTANQLKREVLNRVKTTEQKAKFWRSANHDYVYNQLLDIGPMGWDVETEIKQFGQLRTRYAVLNYPMEEVQERLRTDMIGKVVRKDRGDNAFLFKRIAQLSDDFSRLSKKLLDRYHQMQELRAEIDDKNILIHELRQALKNERTNKNIVSRDPDDIRKIHELKSLVNELNEVKGGEKEEPKEVVIEETPIKAESAQPAEKRSLEGKTIGIIGGNRSEQAEQITECNILTHGGNDQDHEFDALLNESDELVILTRFVSHAAMWKAKAHAITEGKPIHYIKSINIHRILDEIKTITTT